MSTVLLTSNRFLPMQHLGNLEATGSIKNKNFPVATKYFVSLNSNHIRPAVMSLDKLTL